MAKKGKNDLKSRLLKPKEDEKWKPTLRNRIYTIIFGTDTAAGKAFDVVLLILILLSLVVVMLESVNELDAKYHALFFIIEWILTILFTIEYILRIYSSEHPRRYIFSFFGIVDILAIMPTYLTLFFDNTHYLVSVRALRLLRVFRIFKLVHFLGESRVLIKALRASWPKIMVFLIFVLIMVSIMGSVMYLIEGGAESGFTSIPRSIYWAIVTVTTVGYGDIAPSTNLGQFLAALLMIIGYGVIAVPTGIVGAEISKAGDENDDMDFTDSDDVFNGVVPPKKEEIAPKPDVLYENQLEKEEEAIKKELNEHEHGLYPESDDDFACDFCHMKGHAEDALFCKYCGHQL